MSVGTSRTKGELAPSPLTGDDGEDGIPKGEAAAMTRGTTNAAGTCSRTGTTVEVSISEGGDVARTWGWG